MSNRNPSTPPDAVAPSAKDRALAQIHETFASIQETLLIPRAVPAVTGPLAKVKLDLRGKTDDELGLFAQAHAKAMDGNPDFPFPVPTAEQFDATTAHYSRLLIAAINVQNLARQITAALDTARTDLQNALRTRGNYVQITSGGSAQKILSTGLGICADPKPVGQLEPPENFEINRTLIAGHLLFTWEAVEGARTYMIQQSNADTMERNWTQLTINSERKYLATDLPLGQRLAFRIASLGGDTGQSHFSPEVVRLVG